MSLFRTRLPRPTRAQIGVSRLEVQKIFQRGQAPDTAPCNKEMIEVISCMVASEDFAKCRVRPSRPPAARVPLALSCCVVQAQELALEKCTATMVSAHLHF